jgi:hypothetical protein
MKLEYIERHELDETTRTRKAKERAKNKGSLELTEQGLFHFNERKLKKAGTVYNGDGGSLWVISDNQSDTKSFGGNSLTSSAFKSRFKF